MWGRGRSLPASHTGESFTHLESAVVQGKEHGIWSQRGWILSPGCLQQAVWHQTRNSTSLSFSSLWPIKWISWTSWSHSFLPVLTFCCFTNTAAKPLCPHSARNCRTPTECQDSAGYQNSLALRELINPHMPAACKQASRVQWERGVAEQRASGPNRECSRGQSGTASLVMPGPTLE